MGGAARARESVEVNPKFTCFNGTKVQILTLTRLLTRREVLREGEGTRREGHERALLSACRCRRKSATSLLALLVQMYKY